MRLPHRRAHRLLWPALAVLVLLLAAGALIVRPVTGDRQLISREMPR
jgi:hypothetical protein